MCSKWFLGGWMFVCCIWDEAWILNEVDCNLSFCLDLAVFFLNENSSFLLFLCNDLINQLIRRVTILFSHPVMVRESISRIEWDSPSRAQWFHVLICWSHFLPWAALIKSNFFPAWKIPCSQQLYQQALCLSVFNFTRLVSSVFAGHLPSNSAVFEMAFWNYPV